MAFKRALWHSGLTYCQTCPTCKTEVRYTDKELDFRPWYADGFVYCPICKQALRHKEAYAIDGKAPQSEVNPHAATAVHTTTAAPTTAGNAGGFCTQCGKPLREDDRFCSNCGTKRN